MITDEEIKRRLAVIKILVNDIIIEYQRRERKEDGRKD